MTDTINDVPRELKPCPFCGDIPSENSHALTDGGFKYGAIQCGCGALGPDVRTEYKDWPHWRDAAFAAWNERALLSAPSPAGVDGLEVVGWYRMDDRKAITPYPSVCATWHKMGVKVGAAYSDSAQSTVDGLRGEVAAQRVKTCIALKERNDAREERDSFQRVGIRAMEDRDQHAQRIGELTSGIPRIMEASYQARRQRDHLAQCLKFARTTMAVVANNANLRGVEYRSLVTEVKRIDAALSDMQPHAHSGS